MQEIYSAICVLLAMALLFLIPMALTIINAVGLFIRPKKRFFAVTDCLTFILGPLYSILLWACWNPKEYDVALRLPLDFPYHTPIAREYLPTVLVLMCIGILGYAVLRIFRERLSPILLACCLGGLLIGCILGWVVILQLVPHALDTGVLFLGEAGFLCLFPINYILCSIRLVKECMDGYAEAEQKEYKHKLLKRCQQMLYSAKNWPVLAILFALPILLITILILVRFGQQPSAALLAFTKTSDWLLSTQYSPPSVQVDAHYLCTVSLRGHKRLVKPLRYGVRKGERIVVNRQLCVANAFEELIQERMPRFHKGVRRIYDDYGYPISKHIRTAVAADIVYFLMKPLEWIFLFTLYLLDAHPEERIARQYLPKKER